MKIKVKKPNILLITADQFRWDTLGFLNKQNVKTPNIDKLAENSARHHNCFSVSPLCMSARCSILTGLYTHQHGMMDNKGDLSPLLPTLPQALKRHGYNTSMIGKIHFYETIPEKLDLTLCYNELNDLGFDYSWVTGGKTMAEFSTDEWTKHLKSKGLLKYYRDDLDKRKGNDDYAFLPMCLDEEDGVDYLTKETAIKYINNYSKENPFFMWLSFCNPHPIFDAPQKYFNMYNNVQINAAAGFKTNEQQDRMRQSYLGLVTMLDKYIGEVISSLKNKGIYDDTLIVFTADHGEMLCDNGLFGKCYPQEGSAKVPLLACLPGVIESGDYNQMIENTDICATFLEAAGCNNIIDELKESPSKSLFNMWRTGKAVREYAFSENGS